MKNDEAGRPLVTNQKAQDLIPYNQSATPLPEENIDKSSNKFMPFSINRVKQ